MPAKGKTISVNEQILVEAARIYDARGEENTEGKVSGVLAISMLLCSLILSFSVLLLWKLWQDLKSYAKFLSKTDAFTKVLNVPHSSNDRTKILKLFSLRGLASEYHEM